MLEVKEIFENLRRAGIKELKYLEGNKFVDQFGRKIVFYRKKEKGYIIWDFKIE